MWNQRTHCFLKLPNLLNVNFRKGFASVTFVKGMGMNRWHDSGSRWRVGGLEDVCWCIMGHRWTPAEKPGCNQLQSDKWCKDFLFHCIFMLQITFLTSEKSAKSVTQYWTSVERRQRGQTRPGGDGNLHQITVPSQKQAVQLSPHSQGLPAAAAGHFHFSKGLKEPPL